MVSEYVDYLKSLNNSLIRAGIRLPLDLSEDYSALSHSVSILEQYLFFNRVLNICDSGYKIAILSNESKETYEEILKDEFLKEFKAEFEALDSSLLEDPDDELRHTKVIEDFISNVVIDNEVYSESDKYTDDEGNPLSATEMFMQALKFGVSSSEIEDEEEDLEDDDYVDEPYFIEEIGSYVDNLGTDIADDGEESDEDDEDDYEDAYEIDDSDEDEEEFEEDDEYEDAYDSDDEEIDEASSGSVIDDSDEDNLYESDNSDEDDEDPYSFDDEDSDSEEEDDDDEYDDVYDEDSDEDDEEDDEYDDAYEDDSDSEEDEEDDDDPYSDDEDEYDDAYDSDDSDDDEEYEDAYDSDDEEDDDDEYDDAYDSEDEDDEEDPYSEEDDEEDIDFDAYDESEEDEEEDDNPYEDEEEDEDDPYSSDDDEEDDEDEYIDFDDYDEDDEVPFGGTSTPLSMPNQGNITQLPNTQNNMGYRKKTDEEITADQLVVASDAILKGAEKLFSVARKKFKESVSSEPKDDSENN